MTVTGSTSCASWLEDNWDPDLTLGEWWERLGHGGLGGADAAVADATAAG